MSDEMKAGEIPPMPDYWVDETTDPTPIVSVDVLRVLCDATVRLTEIRQRGCSHLCVENFAPECLRNLIDAYARPCPPIVIEDTP